MTKDEHELDSSMTQKHIGPLEKSYAMKMMFDLNEGIGKNF